MNHGAAGEIERGNASAVGIQQPAHSPDHVRHGAVDDQRPQRKKHGHGAEFHALGECAGDQRRRDDGEHELIDHVGLFRNRGCIIGIGSKAYAAQEDVFESADKAVAVGKGQRVSNDCPEDRDQAHHGEALHHGAEDVLAPYEAAVEQREAGAGHQQHKGGGDQHPGVVGIHLGRMDCVLKRFHVGLRRGSLRGMLRNSVRTAETKIQAEETTRKIGNEYQTCLLRKRVGRDLRSDGAFETYAHSSLAHFPSDCREH